MTRLTGLQPIVAKLAPQISQAPADEAERTRYRDRTQHWRRWYKSARWLRRRAAQLRAKPLCEWCKAKGLTVVATIAHHKRPHRGDERLFFEGKLVSLCKDCHDRDAQGIEAKGQ